jgi:hypothetical protein
MRTYSALHLLILRPFFLVAKQSAGRPSFFPAGARDHAGTAAAYRPGVRRTTLGASPARRESRQEVPASAKDQRLFTLFCQKHGRIIP